MKQPRLSSGQESIEFHHLERQGYYTVPKQNSAYIPFKELTHKYRLDRTFLLLTFYQKSYR